MKNKPENIQSDYYKQTAALYDSAHLHNGRDEHTFSLHFLSAMITLYSIKTILDVGAGTGRAIDFISRVHPDVRIIGIEPVLELREQGYKKGIPDSILMEGDGNHIQFGDNEFDLVCEFAVLHHVPDPSRMVGEMLRVSRKFIFISDANNFGQGSYLNRLTKQILRKLGVWKLFDFIRTKGRGYHISEGDGLFYSYSVFSNLDQIKKQCGKVHLMNTDYGDANLYASAPHIALFGIKK